LLLKMASLLLKMACLFLKIACLLLTIVLTSQLASFADAAPLRPLPQIAPIGQRIARWIIAVINAIQLGNLLFLLVMITMTVVQHMQDLSAGTAV